MLMTLMLWIGPPAILFCLVMALRATRINGRTKDIPKDLYGLANSMMDMTGTERKWNLK
jgi:hypothetical protein